MIRTIVGFHLDSEGDWVAEVSCYHNQHIRHRPPFQERAWVLDPTERDARIGSPIECPLCDRAEFPQGLTMLGRAGPWDQDCLPSGTLRGHSVPEGRWGLLQVHEGTIDFQFESQDAPLHLEAGSQQPIPPGVPHRLILTGPVRLGLEFWGRAP